MRGSGLMERLARGVCGECGRELRPGAGRSRYCSLRCKAGALARKAGEMGPEAGHVLELMEAARAARCGELVEAVCAECGREFWHRRWGNGRRYCSPGCRQRAAYRRRKGREGQAGPELVRAVCAICGTEFEYERRRRGRLYCSEGCRRKANHRLEGLRRRGALERPRPCAVCGRLFVPADVGRSLVCSAACARERALGKMRESRERRKG